MLLHTIQNKNQTHLKQQPWLHVPLSSRSNLLHLCGGSRLATIAVLMGLGRSFSRFHRHWLCPCCHSWLLLLFVYPWITLEQAPWFYSFHALHSTGHKSLFQSSAISRRVHIPLFSLRAAPFGTPALLVSACQSLICTSSICSLLTLQFLPLSFMFTLFHLLSLHSFSPNPQIWFIAVACDSQLTHFSWLRCTATLHSNII